jgi:hypothetical protein
MEEMILSRFMRDRRDNINVMYLWDIAVKMDKMGICRLLHLDRF